MVNVDIRIINFFAFFLKSLLFFLVIHKGTCYEAKTSPDFGNFNGNSDLNNQDRFIGDEGWPLEYRQKCGVVDGFTAIDTYMNPRLKCFIRTYNVIYPVKLEVLSIKPILIAFRNVITTLES